VYHGSVVVSDQGVEDGVSDRWRQLRRASKRWPRCSSVHCVTVWTASYLVTTTAWTCCVDALFITPAWMSPGTHSSVCFPVNTIR